MMMKKILPMAIAAAFAAGAAHANTFDNGNFENGTLSGWTTTGITAVTVAPGTDSITGAATTYGGSYAVRVNNAVNDNSISTIKQSVTNYTDNGIFFAWNAVLDGSHGLNDSDYFSLTLHDDTANQDVVFRSYSSAGNLGTAAAVTWTAFPDNFQNGGFQHLDWLTSGWVVESIDLTKAGAGGTSIVGHDFTLTLLAADCPYGGHAGYVYLDGFGGKLPDPDNNVPEPGSLALLGLGLAGLAAARRKKSV